jgi:hypothetical protein
MATRWVYRVADGWWQIGPNSTPELIYTQPSAYAEVELAQDIAPNPRTQRYDAAAPSKVRTATAPEIAAYDDFVLDNDVKISMDVERIFSALVWAIIDTYSAPATVTKHQAARTKIINAYKARPWLT